MNVLGRLKGYNRVRVMPSDKERFFNSLYVSGIGIWDISEEDGKIFFSVRGEDMPPLYSVSRSFGTSVVIVKSCAAVNFISFVRKYRYMLGTFVICAVVLFSLSRYIWQVNIYGVALTDEKLLSEFIYENGYRSGMKKSELSKSGLELLIKTNFPYITSVVSDTDGVMLNITVYESQAPIATYDRSVPVDIVAVKDCVIDEIDVYNGTALVQAGDSVKKGDVLISGRLEYTYKDEKGTRNIHAIGKTLSYEKVFCDNIYVDMYVPSENAPYISEKTIYFMGKSFVFCDDASLTEGYFAKEEKNLQISLGWLNLPILYDETRWYNTRDCREKSDREIYDEISIIIDEKLPEGYTLRNMSYVVRSEGNNKLNISVEADCAVNVGIEREITD